MIRDEEGRQHQAIDYRRAYIRSTLLIQAVIFILLIGLCFALAPNYLLGLSACVSVPIGMFAAWLTLKYRREKFGGSSTAAASECGYEVTEDDSHAGILAVARSLARKAGCAQLKLYIVSDDLCPESPAFVWEDKGSYCIALSLSLVTRFPKEAECIVAHELAHFSLDELATRHLAWIISMALLFTAMFSMFWCAVTFYWAAAVGLSPYGFIARELLLIFSVAWLPWLYKQSELWICGLLHTGEYAADELGAEMIGSRHQMLEALHNIENRLYDGSSMMQSSDSHPSTMDRIMALAD